MQLIHLPGNCACGKQLTVEHAFSCSWGGFPSLRHNDVRNMTHCGRPPCRGLPQRCHVRAPGFWGDKHQGAFFDIRAFNPYAPSNCKSTVESVYRRHEREKRHCYERKILEVEHGSFIPLVFSAVGGMGTAATVMYKRLASLL